jgi:hypothetical protein
VDHKHTLSCAHSCQVYDLLSPHPPTSRGPFPRASTSSSSELHPQNHWLFYTPAERLVRHLSPAEDVFNVHRPLLEGRVIQSRDRWLSAVVPRAEDRHRTPCSDRPLVCPRSSRNNKRNPSRSRNGIITATVYCWRTQLLYLSTKMRDVSVSTGIAGWSHVSLGRVKCLGRDRECQKAQSPNKRSVVTSGEYLTTILNVHFPGCPKGGEGGCEWPARAWWIFVPCSI